VRENPIHRIYTTRECFDAYIFINSKSLIETLFKLFALPVKDSMKNVLFAFVLMLESRWGARRLRVLIMFGGSLRCCGTCIGCSARTSER